MALFGYRHDDATVDSLGKATPVTLAQYKQNIRILINKYLTANPNGTVLLMSCMLPNAQSSWYTQNGWHDGVETALYEIANEYATSNNVCVAPVTSMFSSFEAQGKRTRDVLANNINHPNDFGVRAYAQTVLKTIAGDEYDVRRYGVGTLPDTVDGYEETENYTYNINAVSVFTGATSASQVAFFFSNNGICDDKNQTVDLGYTGWTPSDTDCDNFLAYIKINGTAVKTLFPNCSMQGFNQKAGLCLSGITLQAGDVVSIDKGAVFRHNGISMVMDYTFSLTWNGSSFTASKA